MNIGKIIVKKSYFQHLNILKHTKYPVMRKLFSSLFVFAVIVAALVPMKAKASHAGGGEVIYE